MIAAPALMGCGAQPADRQQALVVGPGCPDAPADVVFFDNFEAGNLNQWTAVTTQPRDAGHSWGVDATAPVFSGASQLRSDPAGTTLSNYFNRLDSAPFSLVGRQNARLRLASRHSVGRNAIFQIYIRNGAGTKVSLVGDFPGQNLAWPGFDTRDIPIPQAFWGEGAVRVSLLMQTGPQGGDFGAAVDNLLVAAEPTGPSCEVAFTDSFEGGNLSKWDVISDPGVAGHVWSIVAAPPNRCASTTEVRSDLAGLTQNLNYTRLETKRFSLVGKAAAVLQVQARWQMGGDDRFQIFFADRDTNNIRSLVADFTGQNPQFPGNSTLTIPFPAVFLGKPNISVAFLSLTGNVLNSGFGSAIDDVQVLTDCSPAPQNE